MPRPTNARPYDPNLAPAFEQELEEKAQGLRQALLPLRAFTQRRYDSIHHVPDIRQQAYHRDTQALEAIPLAVFEFTTTLKHLLAALWQEVLAAEAGTGLRDAQREVQRLQTTERMFDVLLSVVDFPTELLPAHAQQMRAHLDALNARYPDGQPRLSADWEAPYLAGRLKDPADSPAQSSAA